MKTIIAIAAATLAVPAFAEQPAQRASTVAPPAQTGEAAGKAKERRYCIESTITGSRMARKQCRTRAEWMKEGFDPLDPNK